MKRWLLILLPGGLILLALYLWYKSRPTLAAGNGATIIGGGTTSQTSTTTTNTGGLLQQIIGGHSGNGGGLAPLGTGVTVDFTKAFKALTDWAFGYSNSLGDVPNNIAARAENGIGGYLPPEQQPGYSDELNEFGNEPLNNDGDMGEESGLNLNEGAYGQDGSASPFDAGASTGTDSVGYGGGGYGGGDFGGGDFGGGYGGGDFGFSDASGGGYAGGDGGGFGGFA